MEEIARETDCPPISSTTPADPDSGLKDGLIVDPFTVTLNQTDVSYGVKGHNKFYLIQVLRSGGRYFLWTKWGRVGAPTPASNLQPCTSLQDAQSQFRNKFRSKTKNDWDDRDNFTPVEGKYQLVEVQSQTAQLQKCIRLENKRRALMQTAENFPMKTTAEVADLMRFIWDFDRMNRALREMNLDIEKCPLGQLSKSQLQKGYLILRKIQKELERGNRESQLIMLSNDFYTCIPQDFGMKRPPLISHMLRLKEKISLLDALSELEVANSLSFRSLHLLEHNNPVDVHYSELKCSIEHVDSDTMERLQNWVSNTTSPVHNMVITVNRAFTVNREGEAARFWPFQSLPNRKLLWHGSRATNFVGILSQGLRVAPKEAPAHGYMFGKGIYFADIVSKAANYCCVTRGSPEALLLLCEVALGNVHQVTKAKSYKRPPVGFHSVMGVGRMGVSEKEEVLGAEMGCGGIIENEEVGFSDLKFNELVVYDVGQVKMKYLLWCSVQLL